MLSKTARIACVGLALLSPLIAFAFAEADRAAPAEPPMKWEGSVIVALDVTDLAAAKRWYAENLGAKVYFDLSEMGWCELTTPVTNALIGLSQVAPGVAPKGRGAVTLSLGVTNIEEANAFLKARGVKLGEIEEIPETVKLLRFEDGDGNLLMFHQPWRKDAK